MEKVIEFHKEGYNCDEWIIKAFMSKAIKESIEKN